MIKAQIFPSANDGQWYWHIKSHNGQIVAIGGEGYVSKNNCKRAFNRFIKNVLKTIPASVFNELQQLEFSQSLWPDDLVVEVLDKRGRVVQEY
jgi:uncharacterized protein YegP (UPF0339 family)